MTGRLRLEKRKTVRKVGKLYKGEKEKLTALASGISVFNEAEIAGGLMRRNDQERKSYHSNFLWFLKFMHISMILPN